jgi:hypothetical protein
MGTVRLVFMHHKTERMGVAHRPIVVDVEHPQLAKCGALYETFARPLLHGEAATKSRYLFLTHEGRETVAGNRRWDLPITAVPNGPSNLINSATRILIGEEIGYVILVERPSTTYTCIGP